ncbi:hypothetical protein D9M69_550780 [compost metagenome]
MDLGERLAGAHQFFERAQAGLVVVAQAARVVVVDVRELRAAVADFEHLVDLLLVFHHREAHLGVVDREHALGAHGVLVQRHGDRAQRLCGQHGGVEPGPVGPDHHHVFTTPQAGLVQTAGDRLDQLRHGGPGGGLPDAVFLFTHRRRGGAAFRVVQQKLGESRLHCRSLLGLGRGGRSLRRLRDPITIDSFWCGW